MTSKQRAYLKSLAMTMDPIFQIGKASLTPEVIEGIREAIDKRELVKELIALFIDNLYKAENEVIDLISIMKGISKEDAENEDVISFIKCLLQDEKIKSFLQLA